LLPTKCCDRQLGLPKAVGGGVKIARIAGAPKNKEAGVYLNFHVGDKVNIEDALLSVHSKNSKKLKYTVGVFDKTKIIERCRAIWVGGQLIIKRRR